MDWSKVGDQTIRRCELEGLQGMLLQILVEEQLAVVDAAGPEGIRLELSDAGRRIAVRAESRGSREVVFVRVGRKCDASTSIELQRAVRRVLSQLRMPSAERDDAERVGDEERDSSLELVAPGPAWLIAIGAEVRNAPLASLVAGVYWPVGDAIDVGVLVQTNLRWGESTAVEPGAAAHLRFRVSVAELFEMATGPAVGFFGHLLFAEEVRSHPDGWLGIPSALRFLPANLSLVVSPVFRWREVQHFGSSGLVYRLSRWGVWLAIGFDWRS